jgi:hypothetical protein
MSLIIPANSLAGGGYAVDNSLRFNTASSDYLNRIFWKLQEIEEHLDYYLFGLKEVVLGSDKTNI